MDHIDPDTGPHYCTCCNRKLDKAKEVWLELDQRIGEYHTFGVPPDVSQGWFVFGAACARRKERAAREQLRGIL